MEMKNLYFQMLRQGIEELRTEKYQCDKNGLAKALITTLDDLQKVVNELPERNIIERAFEAGRAMQSTNEKGLMWDHKYADFNHFQKDVLHEVINSPVSSSKQDRIIQTKALIKDGKMFIDPMSQQISKDIIMFCDLASGKDESRKHIFYYL